MHEVSEGMCWIAGFTYVFDENLFDLIPSEYLDRINQYSEKIKCDWFGRTLWLRHYFEAYDRVIWVDADVIYADPRAFDIDIPESNGDQ